MSALRMRNAASGRLEELELDAPPLLRLRIWSAGDVSTLAGWRLAHFYACAPAALEYLGFQVELVEDARAPVDVHAGLREPLGPAKLWLKPSGRAVAPEPEVDRLRAQGLDDVALALLCVRARYDQPLQATAADVAGARDEALRLSGTNNFLRASGKGTAPNVKALAGYKKRMRDGLARDLDLTEARAALWDALRPGALSPGSQLAFLKEAAAVLGLAGL